MLTRIRIEAEGATAGAVQADIFAMYDLLCEALYAPEIVRAMNLVDEVYEHTDSPTPYAPRWYKGRAIVRFTNTDTDDPFAVDGERVRHRVDRVANALGKEVAAEAPYPHTEGDHTIIGPECFADATASVICWKGENYYRQQP